MGNLINFSYGIQENDVISNYFCDDDFEILANSSKYNTKEGKAYLKLIVPSGHKIVFKENNKKHVFIKTYGNSIGNDVDTLDVLVENLSKREKTILGVHVKYTFDDGADDCPKKWGIQGEKDKGSVIVGDPFHGENE